MVRRRRGRKTRKARLQRQRAIFGTVTILVVILIAAGAIWWYINSKPPAPPVTPGGEATYITLYFADASDTYLVPVQREVTLGKRENKYMRALKELRLGPYDDPENLLPVLPDGVNILSVEVNNGIARADFNKLLLDVLDETSESWFFKSVLYTLAAFDEVNSIQFAFEGRSVAALPQGTDVSGPRKPGDLNISFNDVPKGDMEKILLYFPEKSGRYLVPLTEYIPRTGSRFSLIEKTINRLIEGPLGYDKDLLLPLFNKGVSLSEQGGVVEEGRTLTVGLSVEGQETGIADDPQKALTALRLTMSNLVDFSQFNVTINGKPAAKVMGLPGKLDDYASLRAPNLLPSPADQPGVEIIEVTDDGGADGDE